MKKSKLLVKSLVAAVAIATAAITVGTVGKYEVVKAEENAGNWMKSSNGRWWYRHTDGSYTQNNWEEISGTWYYFDASGWMKTGWVQSGGTWYYMNSDGSMATGWINSKGTWYYMNSDGSMATGWLKDGVSWYYMNSDGSMAKGWVKYNDAWYYMKPNGAMAMAEWVSSGGNWYYIGQDGTMMTGWLDLSKAYYYATGSGAIYINTNATIGGTTYAFDSSGAATTYYAKGTHNIANTTSKYTIEADVTLSGTGTGYHAKLVACTATAAVSFGLQYDEWGVAPYTDKTTFMVENIATNDAGGQDYTRKGYASLNTTYHLMMTVQANGKCDMYVNGTWVGSETNANLANQIVYLRVEGSGRLNGDSVNATFSNIKLKGSGSYLATKKWDTHNFDTNAGIHSDITKYANEKKITISGKVTGLSAEQDWDNAYGIVSGITQFVE